MANTISEQVQFHNVIKILVMKETLGQRIKRHRNAAGMSQAALAKACGWKSQSRVGNYESDVREPTLADLSLIARALRVDPSDIILDFQSSSGEGAESHANVGPALQPHKESQEYPLISWVIAGGWAEACDTYQPGDADEYLSSSVDAGRCGYWLEVKGRSMIASDGPTSFHPGMRVLVQPENFDVISGKFYIAKLLDTGETTFKQYVRDAGVEYLQPLNVKFEPIVIDSNVQIIGRVVDIRMPPAAL